MPPVSLRYLLPLLLLTSCLQPAEFVYQEADSRKGRNDSRVGDGAPDLATPETHGKDLPRIDVADLPDVGDGGVTDTGDGGAMDIPGGETFDAVDGGPVDATDTGDGGVTDAGDGGVTDTPSGETFDAAEVESDVCVPDCEARECGDDACGGSCWEGVGDECDDGNPCTVDSCEEGLCANQPLPEEDLLPLLDDLQCPCAKPSDCGLLDDDDLCNEVLTCAFSPQDGASLVCQPQAGTGKSYHDKLFCNGLDTCDPGTGEMVAGVPPETDDGIDCTVDACDELNDTVTHTASDALCDDGNSCTVGTCDPGAGCVQAGVVGFCDDSDPCTKEDVCAEGICSGTPYECTDDLDCTDDLCDGDGGCDFPLADGWCLIGEECVEEGTQSPDNPCLACLSEVGTDSFVPDDNQACGSLPFALTTACVAGLCTVLDCEAGRDHCDDSQLNGCETDITTDLLHCGECSKPCDAGQVCSMGECKNECDDGLTKCDPAGCVDTQKNPLFCGNCETACDYDNAKASCVEGECSMGDCLDMWGDANGQPVDGCECMITNQGTELCNTWDDDCDGVVDDVADELIVADPLNCGKCGQVCPAGTTAQVATCAGKQCGLADCGENLWDLNGKAGDGCEYECIHAGGQESCNELDDDCDGNVDEGFDLTTDLENCGACGNQCAHASVAEYLCAGGKCIVLSCNEGFKDANNIGSDGCELAWQPDGELWVDSWDGGTYENGFDGSEDFPFSTIQEAVEYAFEGYLVHVREGIYTGGIEVDIPNLTIQGAGQDLVFVATPTHGTGFHVTADNVSLSNMAISGGQYGVHFQGTEETPLQGGEAKSLTISQLQGTDGEGGDAAGVKLFATTGVQVVSMLISSVNGGTGKPAADWAAGSTGGVAAGGLVVSSTNCVLSSVFVSGAVGGEGGSCSGSAHSSGGAGGIAAGIFMVDTAGCLMTQCAFSGLQGGLGGDTDYDPAAPGADQQAFGVYLSPDSLANEISVSNLAAGEPILYVYGASDVTLDGYVLTAPVNPTNLGKLAVVESEGVVVTNNIISNFQGESGCTGTPCPGGVGAGIRFVACNDCSATSNVISKISGGTGGSCKIDGRVGDPGDGAGIYISASSDCVLAQNTILDIAESVGTTAGWAGSCAWSPFRPGVGVYLADDSLGNTVEPSNTVDSDPVLFFRDITSTVIEGYELTAPSNPTNLGLLVVVDSTEVVVKDNVLQGFTGLSGNGGVVNGQPGDDGQIGAGIRLEGVADAFVENNIVSGVVGGVGGTGGGQGPGGTGGVGAGIYLNDVFGSDLAGNSVADVVGGGGGRGGENGGGGLGGIGAGLYLASGSGQNEFHANIMTGTSGGAGGPPSLFGGVGAPQEGYAVYLEQDSLDNFIAQTNLCNSEPIVYLYGAQEETVEGLDLSSECNPTNLGKLVVLSSSKITVRDCAVANYSAPAGCTGPKYGKACTGEEGAGIRLESCSQCEAERNSVFNIKGGQGGAHAGVNGEAGDGGFASGILLRNSASTVANGNLVWDVRGGDSITKGFRGEAACVTVDASALAQIGGLTCVGGVGNEGFPTHGVLTTHLQPTPLSLSNAIISSVAGYCLHNDEANGPAMLVASYSDLHNCGHAAVHNATQAGTCLEEDPRFVDFYEADFHLQSDSPCVDTGKTTSGYSNEPMPNGCRVNMGAFGNTAEAATNPFAGHCPEGGGCQPNCVDKTCGDDGCGGSCGTCTGQDEVCSAGYQCCVPDCTGKMCGDDGCGGSCSGCFGSQVCTGDGLCVPKVGCFGPIECGRLADMPGPRHSGDAAHWDGKIYYVGGYQTQTEDKTGNTTTVFAYDIASNSWSQPLPDLPAVRSHHGVAILDGTIYVIGGYDKVLFDTVYALDLPDGNWEQVSTAPELVDGIQYGTVPVGDRIAILGANMKTSGNADYALFFDPNSVDNAWTTSGLLKEKGWFRSAVVHDGALYAFGGAFGGNTDAQNLAAVYDAEQDSWTSLPPMPRPRMHAHATSQAGAVMLLLGSEKKTDVLVPVVDAYEPGSGTWDVWAQLATEMQYYHRDAVTVGERVYLFGGKWFAGGESPTARVDVVVFE